MNKNYRIVYAGGTGKVHKLHFATYAKAFDVFNRASMRLHPVGYVEIQERTGDNWFTVDSVTGEAL